MGGYKVNLESLAGHESEVRDTADKVHQAIDDAAVQTSGAGIFNDVATTVKDFADGDWSKAAMDVATDGLDLLGAAMDPLGTLASAGVGFLIEHISFLKEGLDKLAGNPEA